MPERTAIERARRDKRAGKAPSTQAGEFVREEIEHIREGKHGARSTEQAIAIGLSRARRAGVAVPAQGKRATSKRGGADTKKAARPAAKAASATRSRAVTRALKREGHAAATPEALSVHAKKAARSRTASERSASARKAAETKGTKGRAAAARKAVRTRKRRLR